MKIEDNKYELKLEEVRFPGKLTCRPYKLQKSLNERNFSFFPLYNYCGRV